MLPDSKIFEFCFFSKLDGSDEFLRKLAKAGMGENFHLLSQVFVAPSKDGGK